MATSSDHPTDPTPSPLNQLLFGHVCSAAVRAVAVHRIPDQLADGPRTAEDLAASAGLHADSLRRVLRLLAMHGLFTQDEKGTFGLTEAGQALRTDVPGSQHTAALLITDEMFRRSADGLPDAVRTGTTPFEAAYKVPFFAHLAGSPAARHLFDAGMNEMSGQGDDLLAGSYPFPGSGTVVDVGGGRGGFLRAVLSREPALTGVLFDQPDTVADHVLDTEEVRGRWSVAGGDFFTEVPAGGDLYVLKRILHDWNDEDCLRILGSIRRAAAPGKRLLVVDAVLPDNGDPHPAVEVDVIMLMLVSGRERTAKEFEDLFSRAGFKLNRILPTPSPASFIEAEAV
ncbi:methyltransferase [Streptomyces violascens]|uniref:Hydroxyneurosporene-O-methyltransferase n=1 Tax=Streptomyces violascens TaxID=67381 RepID=A0ABQ3QGC6_9ACTN|nr:methyltransferase [Streptomyces violascens]GGT89326.1 hydroxyneurosporene-O-methyltransferase [Streptomyces violascens]GHI36338.1 hydroxyneurosporene-O-methyltransferase [Streptomyces violascens]